jgi:hypothetical protein
VPPGTGTCCCGGPTCVVCPGVILPLTLYLTDNFFGQTLAAAGVTLDPISMVYDSGRDAWIGCGLVPAVVMDTYQGGVLNPACNALVSGTFGIWYRLKCVSIVGGTRWRVDQAGKYCPGLYFGTSPMESDCGTNPWPASGFGFPTPSTLWDTNTDIATLGQGPRCQTVCPEQFFTPHASCDPFDFGFCFDSMAKTHYANGCVWINQ